MRAATGVRREAHETVSSARASEIISSPVIREEIYRGGERRSRSRACLPTLRLRPRLGRDTLARLARSVGLVAQSICSRAVRKRGREGALASHPVALSEVDRLSEI